MKNVTPTSKTLLLVSTLLAFVFLSSCEPPKKHNLILTVFLGGLIGTDVECDSLQMLSTTECYVWIDGRKMKIIGNQLRPRSK